MELLSHLALGFSTALSLQNVAYAFLGCVLGTLIGVLPGLGPLATIATQHFLDRAKLLGGLLRVVYLFSASMPGIVGNLTFRRTANPDLDLEFVVPHPYHDFAGERLDGRLQQLAKLTGKRLAFVFE